MTDTPNVYLMMVPFDRILDVLRKASPKLNKYGSEVGGDTRKMMRLLRDDALLERLAESIWNADNAYAAATRGAVETLERARKDHASEMRKIADTVK